MISGYPKEEKPPQVYYRKRKGLLRVKLVIACTQGRVAESFLKA